MKRMLIRGAVTAGTLAMLAAAHLGFAARAEAGDRHIYGVSNLGDTCGGTCGSTNICCKIVIVAPDA